MTKIKLKKDDIVVVLAIIKNNKTMGNITFTMIKLMKKINKIRDKIKKETKPLTQNMLEKNISSIIYDTASRLL